MRKSFRSFLGFGLLGIMLATAVVPTVAFAQGKKTGKKGKKGKSSQKKGGRGGK